MMPSLFVSHGAPDLVLHDLPARRFLGGLGAALPRPTAGASILRSTPSSTPREASRDWRPGFSMGSTLPVLQPAQMRVRVSITASGVL